MTNLASTSYSLERCPACRARLGDAPACPRCDCNLALVRRVEAQSLDLARLALRAWAAGERRAARIAAERSISLQQNPLASAVKRLVRLDQRSSAPMNSTHSR